MKLRTVKKIWVTFLVNRVYVGTRAFKRKRKLLRSIGWKIGEGTRIVGPIINTGTVEIGKDCWIGRDFTVNGNGHVIIGDNCDIAPQVTFLTGGHEIGGPERRAGKGEKYTVTVGNGCWIGARSTLGRSITVGDSTVIAACACVMKDIPDNVLAGGVPANVIRKFEDDQKAAGEQDN